MILEKTEQIMHTGLNKFSREFNTTETQIYITFPNHELIYWKSKQWQPIAEVSFKEIMDGAFDSFIFENIARPFIKQGFRNLAKELESDKETISVYIFNTDKGIHIAIYCKKSFIKTITLSDFVNGINN